MAEQLREALRLFIQHLNLKRTMEMVAATFFYHSFLRISRPAGWLFAPYLAWVTFAAVLNFALWCLNPL